MKKFVDILIFILALVMMLLAMSACHSQRQLETISDTDSLSLHSLCGMDSLHMDFMLAFDSLTYVIQKDSGIGKSSMINIAGGKLTLTATRENVSSILDSAHVSHNTSNYVCTTPSDFTCRFRWFITICVLIAFGALIIKMK